MSQDLELIVRLYDREVLTIPAHAASLSSTDDLVIQKGFSAHSAGFTQIPDAGRLLLWLDALLPENGAREPFRATARHARFLATGSHGFEAPVGILWGNTTADYAGAVSFARGEGAEGEPGPPSYTRLSDADIEDRLVEAWAIASNATKGPPQRFDERETSLSGVREKIGLTSIHGGLWAAAKGTARNSWIAKHEHNPKYPGEAGMEAICQRACSILGIPSATTLARVFGSVQAVLSARSDRYVDEETDEVLPRHQEELCQALGWPAELKYHQGFPGVSSEPDWPDVCRLLRERSLEAEREPHRLTRILAATVALGNTDQHWRNLGLQHPLPDEAEGVRIAPLYDVSTGAGIKRQTNFRLALPIAGQRQVHMVGPRQWIEHAQRCNLDLETTMGIVTNTMRDAPGAIAQARDKARTEDENVLQDAVNRRCEDLLAHANARAREWTGDLRRLRAAGARGPDQDVSTTADP